MLRKCTTIYAARVISISIIFMIFHTVYVGLYISLILSFASYYEISLNFRAAIFYYFAFTISIKY